MEPLMDRGGDDSFDDDDFPVGPRHTALEVGRRSLVLLCVAASNDLDREQLRAWLVREGLWDEVSPREADILTAKELTDQQRISSGWRVEALQAMLWCVRKIDAMTPLSEQVVPAALLAVMPEFEGETSGFLSSCVLRSDNEIDEELERIVEEHWKIRDARLRSEKYVGDAISGVVVERHWALEWVVNTDDEPWDTVPLMT